MLIDERPSVAHIHNSISQPRFVRSLPNVELPPLVEDVYPRKFMVEQPKHKPELQFDKFRTPSTFIHWKTSFKTEVCSGSHRPAEAVPWSKRVKMAHAADKPKTSRSIFGRQYPNFEMRDARIAAALEKIIKNSNFKTKVHLEEQEAQKRRSTWRSRRLKKEGPLKGAGGSKKKVHLEEQKAQKEGPLRGAAGSKKKVHLEEQKAQKEGPLREDQKAQKEGLLGGAEGPKRRSTSRSRRLKKKVHFEEQKAQKEGPLGGAEGPKRRSTWRNRRPKKMVHFEEQKAQKEGPVGGAEGPKRRST